MADDNWGCVGWSECGTATDFELPPFRPPVNNQQQLQEFLDAEDLLDNVVALDLGGLGRANEGLRRLLRYINEHHIPLSLLDLSGNNIDDTGIEELITNALLNNRTLIYVDLKSNSITDRGCNSLSQAIRSPDCGLLYLGLYGNNISERGRRHFCEAINSGHTRLKGLNLGASEGIPFSGLASLLEAPLPLQTLSLCSVIDDDLGPDSPKQKSLLDLPRLLCSITRLELGSSLLAEDSVYILSDVITNPSCHIKHLDMENNRFSKDAFCSLVTALGSEHSKVECVILSKILVIGQHTIQWIGDEEIRFLVEHSLKSQKCKINMFSDDGLDALREAIEHPCKLVGLDIRHNRYIQEGLHNFRTSLHASETVLQDVVHLNCTCHNQDPNLLLLNQEQEENSGSFPNAFVRKVVDIYVQLQMPIEQMPVHLHVENLHLL